MASPSEPTAAYPAKKRLTLVENITLRLIGLFIFVAPCRGADFLADVVVRTNKRVDEIERERKETSLAA